MAGDDETTWMLDLTAVQADARVDEDGRPYLLLDFGTARVELSGGAHYEEAAAGARRIADGLWDLMISLATRRLAEGGHTPEMPEPKTEPNGRDFL